MKTYTYICVDNHKRSISTVQPIAFVSCPEVSCPHMGMIQNRITKVHKVPDYLQVFYEKQYTKLECKILLSVNSIFWVLDNRVFFLHECKWHITMIIKDIV